MAVLGWRWRVGAVGLALAWPTAPAANARTGLADSSHLEQAEAQQGQDREAQAREAQDSEAQASDAAQQQVRRDQTITSQVKQRLDKDHSLRLADIAVETHLGVVTLAGSVPSEIARLEAVAVARATPGVLRVDDQLRLVSTSPEAPLPP